ncbi:DEAD/DEAH box helicase [Streptomyces griseoincarnatus]|uniref:DEAD/DEAH box helicase n=1 Tax=Streptomyces griseoincarnatus TaxID=29305 RepID=A0ABT0VVL9_STRGI|nr:DEAD/DEAH box helicase [Streptomyces griseoincarnatus]MCM2515392.1 DEAD/DEAH box helicase [Streptomyces griseoincarnatus]
MEWMTPRQAGQLAGCAAVFEPGDPARTGRVAFWDPDGGTPPPAPGGEPGEADLVVPDGDGFAVRTVPVLRLTPAGALPALLHAHRATVTTATGPTTPAERPAPAGPPPPAATTDAPAPTPHPATAFWGAVTALALHLTARERLLPGVSPAGYDTWRAGPFDADDITRIRALADAAPGEAVAVPGTDPHMLVRAFLDAVADTLPRTPAAELTTGRAAFAASAPQHVPQLRAWADEIAAGLDSGVRMSLRVELTDVTAAVAPAEAEDTPPPRPRLIPRAHSLADPTLALDADDLFARADHALGPRAQADTVLAVRRAQAVWPPLERLLPVPTALDLTDGELRDLLGGAAGRLAGHGIDVTWPKTSTGALTARAVAGADRMPPADLRSFLGGDGTVDLRWRLELDGDPLTDDEAATVADGGAVVRLRGRWILVDAGIARKARDRRLPPLTAIEALAVALTGHTDIGGERVRVAPSAWLDALRRALADPDGGDEAVDQPARLTATLRDYQLRGLRWMDRMTSLGLGGCLADDMGLGKTIQLISLHLLRQERPEDRGPTLVVCPASLLGNWEREVGRFAPGTPVRRYHGPGRTLDGADEGFVLTTYGTMRLDPARLGAHTWGLVVADEAQHVKNPHSSTAKALRQIGARARIALTGTPVENNLSELWAVLDWTTPGLLGTHRRFRTRWIAPVEAERVLAANGDGEQHTARLLSELVRPFLLRRRKTDPGIAPELPPKTETDRPVALTAEQDTLYRKQVETVMGEIRAGAGGIARSGLVLKLLTGLKQICNHPAQFLKEDQAPLTGRSGKLELLDELLATITAEGGAALVFTQYVTMARLLERHLRDRGTPAALLHGGTPVARREELVRRFQDGEFPVFLLSLKAAGTGLNLTRADHVVHYDLWWNPAVEAQATDRAHRIGQTRPVQVHRLIAEGTVEDRIAALLEAKKELADSVLGSGEQALTELSNDELANLVELRSMA